MKHDRRDFLKVSGVGLLAPHLLAGATKKPTPAAANGLAAGAPAASGPRCLIIDTDPGVDDAVSILLAFKSTSQVKVEAITVVAGNVESQYGTRNALSLVEYGNRLDIPVALGAVRPLMRPRSPFASRMVTTGSEMSRFLSPGPSWSLSTPPT